MGSINFAMKSVNINCIWPLFKGFRCIFLTASSFSTINGSGWYDSHLK